MSGVRLASLEPSHSCFIPTQLVNRLSFAGAIAVLSAQSFGREYSLPILLITATFYWQTIDTKTDICPVRLIVASLDVAFIALELPSLNRTYLLDIHRELFKAVLSHIPGGESHLCSSPRSFEEALHTIEMKLALRVHDALASLKTFQALVRSACENYEDIDSAIFTLPQHIVLSSSFQCDKSQMKLATLFSIFRMLCEIENLQELFPAQYKNTLELLHMFTELEHIVL
jgi:hypothetical protein